MIGDDEEKKYDVEKEKEGRSERKRKMEVRKMALTRRLICVK